MPAKILTSCLLLLLGLTPAKGLVHIGFSVDRVYDAEGAPVSATGLGLIIADTTGDGFGVITAGSLSVGALIGSSDLILYRADFSRVGAETSGVWYEMASGLALSGEWTAGDSLAFVWFPTLNVSSLVATAGDAYGQAALSEWITPPEGGSVVYQLLSATNDGLFTPSAEYPTFELPDEQLRADHTVAVVPEPAGFSLAFSVLTLAGTLAARGRRHSVSSGRA